MNVASSVSFCRWLVSVCAERCETRAVALERFSSRQRLARCVSDLVLISVIVNMFSLLPLCFHSSIGRRWSGCFSVTDILCRHGTVLPIWCCVQIILANMPFILQGPCQDWQNVFLNGNDLSVVRQWCSQPLSCAFNYTGERRPVLAMVMTTWRCYKNLQYCVHLALLAVWKFFSAGQSTNDEFALTVNGSFLPSMGSIIKYIVQFPLFLHSFPSVCHYFSICGIGCRYCVQQFHCGGNSFRCCVNCCFVGDFPFTLRDSARYSTLFVVVIFLDCGERIASHCVNFRLRQSAYSGPFSS